MDVGQAIRIIREMIMPQAPEDKGRIRADQYDALVIAIECMQKQIPRGLTEYNSKFEDGKCPACGVFFENGDNCHKCGQAIRKQLSECIKTHCDKCVRKGDNPDGTVCVFYAEKSDEIRRLHEEALHEI